METITVINDATVNQAALPAWVFVVGAILVIAIVGTSVGLTFWLLRNK
jgi:hypothetical protein